MATGIVLAGGRGVRLGLGEPKARARLDGGTLLERAVAILREACGDVIVVSPADVDPGASDARRVHDASGHAGPLAGLVAGLEAADSGAAMVLGVDFPLVTAACVQALLDRLGEHDAVVPRPGGIPQPLVAAFAVASAPALRAALESGTTSMREGLERLRVHWIDDEGLASLPGGAGALLNVNTPSDLEVARRALAAGAR